LPTTGGGGMALLPGEIALVLLGVGGLGYATKRAAQR
jgi:hypothetical protein